MARYIPEDVLETIRQRADIVDLIQSYVPTLKKAGSVWKACCPFHHEKTPSFTVNPGRGIYKCFGCGKGGNVFSFIQEMEKMDFPNAAEFLARKCNVIIPDTEPAYKRNWNKGSKPEKPEDSYNVRERLYLLHEKLAAWYAKNLREQPNSPVAKYFATRMLPTETAVQFSIGAAPDSWNAAILFAEKEGFTEQELRLSGIVSTKPENEKHIFDRFRNRLMFPIWNEQGRVVAFSARSIEANPGGWKYVNSPETPVFKKSRTLYALNFARHGISEKGYAVLCEGQLDVIAMHRAGCNNAVAPQGTAFGLDQASILSRYTNTICLALDNDKAGKEAVMKDAAILLPKGFSLKVAVFPDAKDADELLKKQGPEILRKTIENAPDFFDFALDHLSHGLDLSSPAGKAAAASRMAVYLHLIDNPVTQGIYADWLSGKLAISRDTILFEIVRYQKTEQEKKERQARYAQNEPNTTDATGQSEAAAPRTEIPLSMRHPGMKKTLYELLNLLLLSERFAQMASNDISTDMLDQSAAGRALEIVIDAAMNGEWEEAPGRIMMMMTRENIEDDKITSFLMPGENAAEPGNAEIQYHSCLSALTKIILTEKRKRLTQRAMQLSDESEEKMKLMKEITEISRNLLSGKS